MLLDRIDKETTDVTRDELDLTWWLDEGETITTVVSSSIKPGTPGWSEAPYPPPGSPPPYDPTPLTFNSVAMDPTGTVLIVYVRFGTPGNVYTCQFVLQGSSTPARRITVELAVQITGVPPQQPLPVPVLPPPQGALALSITGGTMQGPLYLFEDPIYSNEAATKNYVDGFLPLYGGALTGPLMLAADPTSSLQAATKQYVDAHSGTGGSGGGGFLPISGGAMTGPLTLSGDPTAPLVAATKQYVDGVITRAGGPFLSTLGGTMTGDLTVNSRNLVLSSGNSDAFLSLNNNGGYNCVIMGETAGSARWMLIMPNSDAESGGNVGSNFVINRFSDVGAYIGTPFTINRASGNIAIQQALSVGNGLTVAGSVSISSTFESNNGRVISRGSGNNPGFSAWDLAANAAGGMFQQGANLCFGQMDGTGNAENVLGYFANNGDFVFYHALTIEAGVDAGFYLSAAGGTKYINFSTNGYQLRYNDAGGQLGFYRGGDGAELFQIDSAGNTYHAGAVYCTSVQASGGLFQIAPNYYMQRGNDGTWRWVEGGTIHLSLDTAGNLFPTGSLVAGNDVRASNGTYGYNGVFCGSGNDFCLNFGGAGRIMQFAGGWYWNWNGSNGNLYWVAAGGTMLEIRASDGYFGNDRGAMYGYGPYINLSDERAKQNIQSSSFGLDDVLKIDVISFRRIGSDRVEHGFSAQQLRDVLPHAVVPIGVELADGSGGVDDSNPTLGVAIDAVVAALVNSSKQLTARIAALEAMSLR